MIMKKGSLVLLVMIAGLGMNAYAAECTSENGPGSIAKQYDAALTEAAADEIEEKDHSAITDCISALDSWGGAMNYGLPNIGSLKKSLCKVANNLVQDAINELTVDLQLDLPDEVSGYLDNPSVQLGNTSSGNGINIDYGGYSGNVSEDAASVLESKAKSLADELYEKMR